MWGFSSSSASKSKQKQQPSSSALDFSELGLALPDVDHIDVSDVDLNDPSLLAELAELSGEPAHTKQSTPKPKPQTKPAQKKVAAVSASPAHFQQPDIDKLVADIHLPPESDDVHVELTEEDMNDPHLLAELSQIGGGDDSDAHELDPSSASEQVSPVLERSSTSTHPVIDENESPLQPAVADQDDQEQSIDHLLASTDKDLLAKHIQTEKSKALNQKRSGDKSSALESLRNAKRLETRLQELASTKPEKHVSPTVGSVPVSVEPNSVVSSHDRSAQSVSLVSRQNGSSPQISMTMLQQRVNDLKQSALAAKRANNTTVAREALVAMKRVQEVLDTVKSGGSVPHGFVLPEIPVIVSAPSESSTQKPNPSQPKVNPSQPITIPAGSIPPPTASSISSDSKDIYDIVLSTLTSQINLCTTLSAQYFKSNQKDLALDFHKRKKAMTSDMETVTASRSTTTSSSGSMLPFTVQYQPLTYTIAQTHQDVEIDEMEMNVIRAMDLVGKDGIASADLETCVTFDVGWPTQDGDTGSTISMSGSNDGRGETGLIRKSSCPEYGFVKRVRIDRASRPFQRYLERRKATFDVVMVKPGLLSFMTGRRVVLGRATLKLDTLLNKCEVHEMMDLMDPGNPRKATGSKLEVKIRMRAPLVKPDIVTKTERWLIVHFGAPQETQPAIQQVQSKQNSTEKASTISPQTSKETSPAIASTTSPDKTNSSSPEKESQIDIESLEMEFLDPENIASNQVLENEHAQIVAEIAQLQASRKPVPSDLSDRKSAYEIRMQMLVTLVQIGKLTMGDYMKQVRDALKKTQTEALEFKRAGKIQYARQALARIKLMKAEIEEVESAGAAE